MKPIVQFAVLMTVLAAVPGSWTVQTSGTTSRLRGISVVNETNAWASGANGTVLRTTDGGAHWMSQPGPGGEKLDFRDIYGVDADSAYILSIGEGTSSRIYKTSDGGRSWMLQYQNADPKAFFDGIAFWDSARGIAFSDPVDGKFVIIRTMDGGAHWDEVPPVNIPEAMPKEAAFAASGTSIVVSRPNNAWIGTGGGAARVFRSTDAGLHWQVSSTPIASGAGSAGIFSLAFRDSRNGVAAGGDYQKEKASSTNFAFTTDGGKTWKAGSPLPGYRSVVSYIRNGARWDLIAAGPSGSDYSPDGGRTWLSINTTGYDTMSFLPNLPLGFASGAEGRIAKWTMTVH